MIIPTLGTGQLYQVHRNKVEMLTKMEKRRAFFLVCGITICVSIVTYVWIMYT